MAIFIAKMCRYLTVDLIFVVINGCIVNTSLALWAPLLHHISVCEVGYPVDVSQDLISGSKFMTLAHRQYPSFLIAFTYYFS